MSSGSIVRPTGYRIDLERRNELEMYGEEPAVMMARFKDVFPPTNPEADPLGVFDILDQGQQGSCQGHSLAGVFTICYFLATGRKEQFSRAAGYYLSQRYDGISGDQGSTLSGGNKVATIHGLPLEKYWPYPSRYDPREPQGVPYVYKLKRSKPLKTIAEVIAWRDSGLPIQTGMSWNASCDREIVDSWNSGGGGHSTIFWQRTGNGLTIMENSWSRGWRGDGCNQWTDAAIEQMLRHQWSVLIGYAPDEMSFPIPDPI